MKLSRIESAVRDALKPLLSDGMKVAIAVSGGLDSTVLLAAVAHWISRPTDRALRPQFKVVHVHHKVRGRRSSKAQTDFRQAAARAVAAQVKGIDLPFVELKAVCESDSEADLRDGRMQALIKAAADKEFDAVVFAHHRDDLLETRLIRLLRGTGPDGLESMQSQARLPSGLLIVRPLLPFWRKDLELERKRHGQMQILEDPSNADTRYLRNAVRSQLIPLLDQLRQGGKLAMARSLDRIAAAHQAEHEIHAKKQLSRSELMRLDRFQRAEAVGRIAKAQGVTLSWTRCSEVAKRLETKRKSISFIVGQVSWTLQGDHLAVVHEES